MTADHLTDRKVLMSSGEEWANDDPRPGCFGGLLSIVDVVVQLWDVLVARVRAAVTKPRTYVVEFERVGRNRNVKPLTTTARDADELAEKIYDHARPHLGSQAVHVDVDLDELRGFIMAGFRDAGRFTITAGGGSR